MACGEIGLTVSYYYSLTQRQFYNIVNGYQKKEDMLSRERLIIGRKIMWSAMWPHVKLENFKETDVFQFSWEKDMLKKISEKEYQEMLEAERISKAFFDRYDAKKARLKAQA